MSVLVMASKAESIVLFFILYMYTCQNKYFLPSFLPSFQAARLLFVVFVQRIRWSVAASPVADSLGIRTLLRSGSDAPCPGYNESILVTRIDATACSCHMPQKAPGRIQSATSFLYSWSMSLSVRVAPGTYQGEYCAYLNATLRVSSVANPRERNASSRYSALCAISS